MCTFGELYHSGVSTELFFDKVESAATNYNQWKTRHSHPHQGAQAKGRTSKASKKFLMVEGAHRFTIPQDTRSTLGLR
jgi:hypothetical protein